MPRRQRRLRPNQAKSAIYIDFEGRAVEGEPPALLGILDGDDVRQFVFDRACAAVDRAAGGGCLHVPIRSALGELVALSDTERRHLVSWSTHDRTILRDQTGGRAFRWRNAIPVARRWRRRQETAGAIAPDPDDDNNLRRYERLIGYQRPDEPYGVGEAIAYIRRRSSVTPGAIERWQTVLEHNRHDLLAMRAVVRRVLDLD